MFAFLTSLREREEYINGKIELINALCVFPRRLVNGHTQISIISFSAYAPVILVSVILLPLLLLYFSSL